MADFVEDWAIYHTLGEGAYGEVKLVVNKTSGDCVAMKVIDLVKGGPSVKSCVEKEVKIHKFLKDNHIIRCYGSREQSNLFYIFLEYAPNGELFDRIEPDVGMPPDQAQKFMKQLIAGMAYIHKCGIAHRDIKPENLLLDKNDNLKISDFGLATIFRLNGKERALEKKCGTLPYVAPEVLTRPYAAGPADVWSCGIVLIAMLAGELPWDKPSDDSSEYTTWRKGDYMNLAPWSKLDTISLSLIKSILNHLPSSRPTPEQISQHRWLKSSLKKSSKFSGPERKRLKETLSQTAVRITDTVDDGQSLTSYSQPVAPLEDILLSTQQILATQTTVQNCLQKLVRRMTRFYVSLGASEAIQELTTVLEKLSLDWSMTSDFVVTISSVDRRKTPLVFKATAFEAEAGTTLIDVRLSKGDGLEFKKFFLSIRSSIKTFIVRPPTDSAACFLPSVPSP